MQVIHKIKVQDFHWTLELLEFYNNLNIVSNYYVPLFHLDLIHEHKKIPIYIYILINKNYHLFKHFKICR
jgi:hypothetical protein